MAEQTIEGLKLQLKGANERLYLYENDPEKRAYFALVRIVNQQVDLLNTFNIKSNIGGKPSEDGTFVRTQGIWKDLPAMITSLKELKITLKINPDEEKKEEIKRRLITAESIADSVGELAGKKQYN